MIEQVHACAGQCANILDGINFPSKSLDRMQFPTTDQHEGVKQCKAICRCALLAPLLPASRGSYSSMQA